jgi:lysophospholipase L1-like esterase
VGRAARIALIGSVPLVLGVVVLGTAASRTREDGAARGSDGRRPPVPADEVGEGADPEEVRVVVIGDSVVEQSSGEIQAAVGPPASVIGLPGYRTDELLPTIRDAVDGGRAADVVVVIAGHNDLWQRVEERAPLDELMGAVALAPCSIWVHVPTKGEWDAGRARAFGRRVEEAAAAAGVVVETVWRDAVDARPGPRPDPDLVAPDLVHPTDAGRRRIAEVVAVAVARHCG